MNITSIEFHPEGSSQVVVLSFRDPRRLNPYNVKALDGLDVDEIRPKFYSGSGSPTKKFQNLSPGERKVVARIELNPTFSEEQTYSDLRDDLYRMISSSRTGVVLIKFKNGNTVVAQLPGTISKFEAPIMTKTPEVQITFDCGDVMLQAPTRTEIDVDSLDLSNFTLPDPLSTAHHGFALSINILDPMPSFSMFDPSDPLWSFDVSPVGGFEDNDILAISSELNNKYLLIIRGLTAIYLADVLLPGSVWPIMFPGDNTFGFYNPSSLALLEASYFPTYWGV